MAAPGTDTVYDLTILYMSDVTNWCEYLFDIFNPFEVYQQSEEITEFPTHESTIHHIRSSRVQVLIISPQFIETATSQISQITGKNSVVGLLCGVEKEELVRLEDRIPDYVNWRLVDAKDGPRCITSTTLDIVDKMIRIADQQGADAAGGEEESNYMPMTDRKESGSSNHQGLPENPYLEMGVPEEELYLDMDLPPAPPPEELYLEMDLPPAPKKEGDDDIYLIMDGAQSKGSNSDCPDQQYPSDDLYICPTDHQSISDDTYDFSENMISHYEFEDTYDLTEIGTLPPRGSQCIVVPDKVRAGVAEKVVVIFSSSNMAQNFDGSYKIHIGFDKKSADVVARVLNQHTLRFESPTDLPGGMYKCTLTHNGKQKATFKLAIQSPATILSDILSKTLNPLNYLCDVLGISPADSNQLDNELHEQCKKYMPHGGFVDVLPVEQASGGKQSTIYPTALHFAAKLGLPCVCAMLCQWPGADQALRMKNIDGKTPDQMTTDEGLKSFLLGRKERLIAQQQAPGDTGYVRMTKDQQKNSRKGEEGPNAHSDQDNPQNRPAYDFPFPVAIPVNFSKDADIHKIISGDPDDIYNFYDSWEKTDMGSSMVRDGDDDEDDDDTQDYETLETEGSSGSHPEKSPGSHPEKSPGAPVGGPDERPEPPAASRKPVQSQSDSKRDPDAKLQSLIDIQERVKNNEISMDQAVILFREWEQSHNHAQSMSARRGADDRQSSIQKLFRRKPRPPTGISPHAARGRGADISERPERSPTSPVSSRLNPMNGTSENGPSGDQNQSENGSDGNPTEPPPLRSPRPNAPKDPVKRMSWRNQPNFSPDYIDRPIPPIPPRISSAATSNYTRLPGARPVLMFPTDGRGRTPLPGMASGGGVGLGGGGGGGERGGGGVDSDAIPEHSEHSVPQTPEGLPDRMAPLPPRRSDNTRTPGESPRRQSDPSVTSKDGGDPTSPPASDKAKRPVPRPRAPPRPR